MPEFKFNPSNYSSFLTEFSFCDCFKIIDTKNLCTVCNSRGKHFLTVNNFLEESCRICKEYFKITSGEFNCEFSIYTDGISPFKKSDICLWPIFIVFNKIPYKHRYELGNFCILGIYFGRVKPNMQKILELSFKRDLKSLNSSFLYENINFTFNLKFLICDKPAKSLVLNFQSSNAHYFCPVCVSTSKTQQINGTKHTFIPIENFFNAEKRTEANYISLAYSAAENHVAEFGIKGFCFLTNINNFSITGSNYIDYMHSLCLGIVKKSLELSLTIYEKKKEFLNHCKHIVSKIELPSSISVNSLDLEGLRKWKAKDFRTFLFYISPLICSPELSDINVLFSSLAEGSLILFKEFITEEERCKSLQYFKKFILKFISLFSNKYLTPNFHDLAHLPDIAMKSGPLYEFSAYNFEHLNGRIARICKGTKRLDKQIIFKINNFVKSSLFNSAQIECPEIESFKKSMFERKKWKPSYFVNSFLYFSGISKKANLTENELLFLKNLFGQDIKSIYLYKRAVCFKLFLSTSDYDKNKICTNSIFLSNNSNFCIEIVKLGLLKNNNEEINEKVFIFCKKYSLTKVNSILFRKIGSSEDLCLEVLDCYRNFSQGIRLENFFIKKVNTENF